MDAPTSGKLRWMCKAEQWTPTLEQWRATLRKIETLDDVQRILRFHKGAASAAGYPHHERPDPKCFAVARLMLQRAARGVLGDSTYKRGRWARSEAGKPHFRFDGEGIDGTPLALSWNVNVSHAGGVVVLAAEPHDLVGVDVMPVELVPEGTVVGDATVAEFFHYFRTYFTSTEWVWIEGSTTDCSCRAGALLKRFFVLWTLKEAYIKAIGIGLGFELQRASFTLSRDDVWRPEFFSAVAIELAVDGVHVTPHDWNFAVAEELAWNVVIAVATGPPREGLLWGVGHAGDKLNEFTASGPFLTFAAEEFA